MTLTGSITATPGTYDYTITTLGGNSTSCNHLSIDGRIIVLGTSSISLLNGSDKQQVCGKGTIEKIEYKIENALLAEVSELPAGLYDRFDAESELLTIEGSVATLISETTEFQYTVTTINNTYSCTPEATVTGTITIVPDQKIDLLTPEPSQQQSICIGLAIDTIRYKLNESVDSYTIVGLPNGITTAYDPIQKSYPLLVRLP